MNNYLEVIKESFAFFPVAAFLFTAPYILWNYYKYGSVLSLRIVIVYSYILYLMNVFFLVILPLPPFEEVQAMTGPRTQLIPFTFVREIIREVNETGSPFYCNFSFYQVFFNVVMTIPFGMYLRYYFQCSFKKTLVFSFLLTLFCEVTQLTGLFFIYPRSYRMFDVDDLMANTLGGVLGFLLVKPFMRILPSRQEIDAASKKRGQQVSLLRRLTAFGIDMGILGVFDLACAVFFDRVRHNGGKFILFSILVYFCFLPLITKGQTVGCYFAKIKLVSTKKKTYRGQIFIRYALMIFIAWKLPQALLYACRLVVNTVKSDEMRFACFGVGIGLFAFWLLFEFLMMCLHKPLLCERISMTKFVSTIEE